MKLTPGKNMDRIVAIEVMGMDMEDYPGFAPRFSTSVAAAIGVVEELSKKGDVTLFRNLTGWDIEIVARDGKENVVSALFKASLPEVICLAALEFKGFNID